MPSEGDLLFQNYLVSFVDILGQRSVLREIKGIPANEEEKAVFISNIKKTIVKVEVLRRAFKNYFTSAQSHTPNTDLVSPEDRDEFIACQKSEAYFYGFSDSIIIAVPLMSTDENCTAINGVFSSFIATSGIGLLGLASNIILRGGLDVGVATEIEEKEIYGPALERAYFLESNMAEYPRFVVGKDLIQYILWVENQEYKTRLGFVAKNVAKKCREMIVQDGDGNFMLDFMGKISKESADNSIGTDVVKQVWDLVVSQYKEYSESDNHKLASRYFRLLRYVESRIKLWGIE